MKHADKLVFGTLNGITLTSFAESLNVFDGLPRLVVMVSHSYTSGGQTMNTEIEIAKHRQVPVRGCFVASEEKGSDVNVLC